MRFGTVAPFPGLARRRLARDGTCSVRTSGWKVLCSHLGTGDESLNFTRVQLRRAPSPVLHNACVGNQDGREGPGMSISCSWLHNFLTCPSEWRGRLHPAMQTP
jgi:hypothetical protein